MDRFISRLNIEHYRDLLAVETREPEPERLIQLLSEELIKLSKAERAPAKARTRAIVFPREDPVVLVRCEVERISIGARFSGNF